MKEGPKKINLLDIDEGKNIVAKENEGTRRLLAGFKYANIKIHLLTDDLAKLYGKQKYADLFDIGVFSIHSANKITESMNVIFKNKAKIHIETCDNLCVIRKDGRSQFRQLIAKKCDEAKWLPMNSPPYMHHMFYEVNKDELKLDDLD